MVRQTIQAWHPLHCGRVRWRRWYYGGLVCFLCFSDTAETNAESSDQAWTTILQTLVASVQRLSGRKLPIGNTKTLEEERRELRNQLEELAREVCFVYPSLSPSHCLHRTRR